MEMERNDTYSKKGKGDPALANRPETRHERLGLAKVRAARHTSLDGSQHRPPIAVPQGIQRDPEVGQQRLAPEDPVVVGLNRRPMGLLHRHHERPAAGLQADQFRGSRRPG